MGIMKAITTVLQCLASCCGTSRPREKGRRWEPGPDEEEQEEQWSQYDDLSDNNGTTDAVAVANENITWMMVETKGDNYNIKLFGTDYWAMVTCFEDHDVYYFWNFGKLAFFKKFYRRVLTVEYKTDGEMDKIRKKQNKLPAT